jgi:hypothetical protein
LRDKLLLLSRRVGGRSPTTALALSCANLARTAGSDVAQTSRRVRFPTSSVEEIAAT